MKSKSLTIAAAMASLVIFSAAVFAHHGSAAYDTDTTLTFKSFSFKKDQAPQ